MSTTVRRTTPPAEPQFETDEIVGYARSPSDWLRLLVYAVLTAGLLALTRWAQDALLGFEHDVVQLLDFLSSPFERILAGVAQLFVLIVGVGVFAVPLLLRRLRLFGYLLVASFVASTLMEVALAWLDRARLSIVEHELAARAGVHLGGTLRPTSIAAVTASFVVLAPFVSQRWRRAGAVTLVLYVVIRLLLSEQLPGEIFFALALGATVGVAILLAFGRPDQHPTRGAVAAALAVNGLVVARLDPAADDAHGSRVFLASIDDGQRLLVKVRSPAERSADLLYRLYRYGRFKNVGDERPFSSLRRAVEHEALVSLQARDVGVRTPRLRAIAEAGTDSMVLAFDDVQGTSIAAGADDVSDDVSDDLLRAIWEQVAIMRAHRIAHRDLRHTNVLVDATGAPWFVNFGFGEVGVPDAPLDTDVAELLCAIALIAGTERAVQSAIDGVGVDALRAALPRLQLNALSSDTRAAMRRAKGLLKELQKTVAERAGVDQPEFVPLARVDRKTVLTIVMLVLVTYFLLPQLADLPGIVDQIKAADWVWFVPVVAASVLTYVGATLGITGSVPDRLRVVPTFLAQVAASFAGTLAPASVGGLALNVRYLQKTGVDPAVAVPAVGLNAVAGFGVHILLLVLFLIWAGKSAFGSIHLPDPTVLLYGAAAVVALAVVAFSIPWVRHTLRQRLVPVLERSVTGLWAVLRRPLDLTLLIGGSVVVTGGYMAAIYFSTRAFGGELGFQQVGAIYLAASAVAAAAPTPGGLGALEAATIAGLVAAGMPNDIAVPSVFLFRLATFWLPILPGWITFEYLQREDYL